MQSKGDVKPQQECSTSSWGQFSLWVVLNSSSGRVQSLWTSPVSRILGHNSYRNCIGLGILLRVSGTSPHLWSQTKTYLTCERCDLLWVLKMFMWSKPECRGDNSVGGKVDKYGTKSADKLLHLFPHPFQ